MWNRRIARSQAATSRTRKTNGLSQSARRPSRRDAPLSGPVMVSSLDAPSRTLTLPAMNWFILADQARRGQGEACRRERSGVDCSMNAAPQLSLLDATFYERPVRL